MSFTRAKPSGWVSLEQITPAQINQIDTNQSNAIDGAAGGDYAPTNPIGLSNDLEIKSGADLIVESGGKLVANAGSAVELSADLDMLAGADIELAASCEIKTTNARQCNMPIPLWVDGKFPNTAGTPLYSDAINDWGIGSSGTFAEGLPIQWDTSTATEWMVCRIPPIPPSATIISLKVTVQAAVVHSALPAQMPQIRLVRYATDGTRTVVGTATDPSASLVTYEAQHLISLTGLTEVTNPGRWYRLEVCGEYGANSQPTSFFRVQYAFVEFTTTRVNHQNFETVLA